MNEVLNVLRWIVWYFLLFLLLKYNTCIKYVIKQCYSEFESNSSSCFDVWSKYVNTIQKCTSQGMQLPPSQFCRSILSGYCDTMKKMVILSFLQILTYLKNHLACWLRSAIHLYSTVQPVQNDSCISFHTAALHFPKKWPTRQRHLTWDW